MKVPVRRRFLLAASRPVSVPVCCGPVNPADRFAHGRRSHPPPAPLRGPVDPRRPRTACDQVSLDVQRHNLGHTSRHQAAEAGRRRRYLNLLAYQHIFRFLPYAFMALSFAAVLCISSHYHLTSYSRLCFFSHV